MLPTSTRYARRRPPISTEETPLQTKDYFDLLCRVQIITLASDLSFSDKNSLVFDILIEELGAHMAYAVMTEAEEEKLIFQGGPYVFQELSQEFHPLRQRIYDAVSGGKNIVLTKEDCYGEVKKIIAMPLFVDGAPSGHLAFACASEDMPPPTKDMWRILNIITLWISREITDKRNFASLEANNLKLIDSNRELEDFAHIASHDLKAPVRGMANYAQFLIEDHSDQLDTEGKNMLLSIQELAKKMDALLTNLLTYSRLGIVEMAFQPTHMGELAEGVRKTVLLEREGEAITIDIAENMPTVLCDHVRIEEVIRNLVTNGLKYKESSEKRIEIGHLPARAENDFMPVFSVRDNGIGIEDRHKDTVFQIFKRLHREGEYGGGTGSGLTLIRKIILRHGGRIWFESEKGKGSVFFFTLGNHGV